MTAARLTHEIIPLPQQLLDLKTLGHAHSFVENVAGFRTRLIRHVRIAPRLQPSSQPRTNGKRRRTRQDTTSHNRTTGHTRQSMSVEQNTATAVDLCYLRQHDPQCKRTFTILTRPSMMARNVSSHRLRPPWATPMTIFLTQESSLCTWSTR